MPVKQRLVMAVLAWAAIFGVACSGDDGSSASTEVPPTIPVTLPASSGTPSAPATTITPANAAQLRAANRARVETPQGMAWRPDSSAVLIYTNGKVEELKGVASAPLNHVVASLPESERIVAVNAKGEGSFLTLAGNKDINVRSLTTGAVIKAIHRDAPVSNAQYAPSGSQAVIQRLDKIAVDLISLPDGGEIKELSGFETAAPVYGVRFSDDGKSLIWISRATVQVMDVASGDLGEPIMRQEFVSAVALSHRAGELTLATIEGSQIHLFDPENGREHAIIPLSAPGQAIVYSPDSALIAAGTTAGVRILDAGSLMLASLPGDVRQVSFSPDGSALATIDETGEVVIWKVAA